MTARIAALVAILLVTACTPPAESPRVFVEPLASGEWRATWQAGVPIDSLRFSSAAGYLREREWRVVTPGYSFSRDGDAQTLVRADGATAARTVTAEFPRNTDFIARDYELFNTFTDGSVALFAGHFVADVNDAMTLDRVSVRAPAGQVAVGESYVYVGGIEPVEHEDFVAVLDPGLPPWLTATVATYLPRILDVYADRTGRELAEKPVVLFSHDPASASSEFNGGVVGSQIQLRVSGDWGRDDPWAMRTALRMIAHEAAHLWNGNLVEPARDASPWLHEGAAEAFADEALVATRVMDETALHSARERAVNECLAGRRTVYSCGQVAGWWSTLADGEDDTFLLWGALIERVGANGGRYDEGDWFELLAARGVGPDTIDALRAFTSATGAPDAAVLQRGLADAGVRLVRDDLAADGDASVRASGAVVLAVLAGDCTGTYGFYTRGDALELAGLGDCRTAREGMRVDALGPHALDAPGLAAARYALERCAAHTTIDVAGTVFACPPEPPELTGYWRVE